MTAYSNPNRGARPVPRRPQAGVVLFVTLVILVAMTLAGIALFRQIGAGIIIAGNLTFRESATFSADRGLEDGRAWLKAQLTSTLETEQPGIGYYSSWFISDRHAFEPLDHNWSANSRLVTSDDGAGNEIRVVVHRLCELANASINAIGQRCITYNSATTGVSRGELDTASQVKENVMQPYFRVTVRVSGPRNTKSYVQMIMY